MKKIRNCCFLVALIALGGTVQNLSAQSTKTDELTPYNVQVVGDGEFAKLAETACKKANGKKKVLLEFSAPWCGDCKGLHAMKQVGSLKKELENWEVLVVNIGKFEHHEALLKHFGLKAIADWRVLVPPKDCSKPITTWSVGAQRTLEPISGKPVSVSSLSSWLKTERRK